MLIRMEQSQARAAVNMPYNLYRTEMKRTHSREFPNNRILGLVLHSTIWLRVILNRESKVVKPPSVVFVGFRTLKKESWTYAV